MITFLPDQRFRICGSKTNFRTKIGGHLGFSVCCRWNRNENPNEGYFLITYDILHQIKLSPGISEKTPLYSPLLFTLIIFKHSTFRNEVYAITDWKTMREIEFAWLCILIYSCIIFLLIRIVLNYYEKMTREN